MRVSAAQLMAPPPFRWTIPHVTSWMAQSNIPPELPGLVYAKLGDTAWQRFHDFSRWPDGWAGPHSQSIAWGTYRNFTKFLDAARFVASRPPPSLFVTDAGELELTWEARDGSAISVTVTPEGASYFFESMGEENQVTPEQLSELAERCNQATL